MWNVDTPDQKAAPAPLGPAIKISTCVFPEGSLALSSLCESNHRRSIWEMQEAPACLLLDLQASLQRCCQFMTLVKGTGFYQAQRKADNSFHAGHWTPRWQCFSVISRLGYIHFMCMFIYTYINKIKWPRTEEFDSTLLDWKVSSSLVFSLKLS